MSSNKKATALGTLTNHDGKRALSNNDTKDVQPAAKKLKSHNRTMSIEAAQNQLDGSASEIAKKDRTIQDRTKEIAALKAQLATAERSLTIAKNAKKRIQEKNSEALEMVKSDSALIFEKVSLKRAGEPYESLGRDAMDDMIGLKNDADIIKLARELTVTKGHNAVLGAIKSIKAECDKQETPSPALTDAITILVQHVLAAKPSSNRLDINTLLLLASVVGLATNPTQYYSELATAVNQVAANLKEKKTSMLSWSDRGKDFITDLLVPVHDAVENECTKEGLMREIKAGLLESVNEIEVAKDYAMPDEAEIARKAGFSDVHKFLLSPTETTLNLNLSKEGRKAVHRLIDYSLGYGKVSHSSVGSGRSRYLVLKKCDAESPADLKAKKERKEKHTELLVKFSMYQKYTLTLPPTGTKLGLILTTNTASGNMTEIKDVVANSPLMNLIPKDICIVSLKGDAIGFVQPRSMQDTIESFAKVQTAASRQIEFIVVPTDTISA
ncbi:hypothetical protein ACHAWT_005353 [Skeletonema menzelii]